MKIENSAVAKWKLLLYLDHVSNKCKLTNRCLLTLDNLTDVLESFYAAQLLIILFQPKKKKSKYNFVESFRVIIF